MDELHTAASERAVTAHPGPRRVVVGVAGSIAAYKTPSIIRLLRQAGHEVKVVATESALRFIGAPALAAVSGQTVSTGVFDDPAAVEHVSVAEWADLVLVAPASADLLARIRAGRADDMLTATILTSQAPIILAPAMHAQMWLNPATRDNVAVLRGRGLRVIEPDSGRLTGKDSGLGRLPEPEQIVSHALAVLQQVRGKKCVVEPGEGGSPLKGRRIVVSAGGTREPIDPVRYVGNRSSGRQGCALAAAAVEQGAHVTLVQAHVASELLDALPSEVTIVTAGTARDMLHAVREAAHDADAVIMAAAVADYRPIRVAATKIKKQMLTASDRVSGPRMSIELTANPDILAGLVSDPPRAGQIVVGFAAETGDDDGDVLFHGRAKARRKGAHLLAVNAVGEDLGFGDVPNMVVVLDSRGSEVARGQGSKMEIARLLISLTADLVNGS